ncbi:GNAT family N-acetyltransferase [Evansella halocellulosilytica]|uniref:GNAT family N-acetyltransferase n=1 Tax=Evansella halocellulosilytica TaxID=2011013 RepID=UPI000BB8C9BC|nr:GNAT family N-acetyltransferase [Evansella halocellulosilytica]
MKNVLTKKLAQKVERSEIDALHSRLTAVMKRAGNPMGVQIKEFGRATAFTVKHIPGPSFNKVLGLTSDDTEYIDQIVDYYNEKEIPVRFDIPPANSSQQLLASLSDRRFAQSDFHTSLYRFLHDFQEKEMNTTNIAIRPLRLDEFSLFGDLYVRAFQMPPFLKEPIAENNEVLHHNDHWTFYLAELNGKPAGIGVLFKYDGVATLAASATVPEFRNNGVHRALIQTRLNEAKQSGCYLAIGQAAYASVSQNNMERAGMKIAYTKAIWQSQK